MVRADGSGQQSKVSRVLEEYGIEALGKNLEAYWTGEAEERYSLRELADFINERLLEAAIERTEEEPLSGEVENVYRLLTEEDVTAGDRMEARRRLERIGVDIDALENDFVSHQAVHTYLTKYKDVAAPDESEHRSESSRETIERLRSRVQSVTQTTLRSLEKAGDVSIGDATVFVDVNVLCNDCQTQYSVTELIDRGGCDCE